MAERITVPISVVIPTSGPSERLNRCLEALHFQTLPLQDVQVVEVSAASPERAYCHAVNAGINATSGEWVLLLNDDVILASTFLERLLHDAPLDEQIGMLCGKLLRPDGMTIDSTGQFVSRARTAQERGYNQQDHGQFQTPGYVFSVPGAAAVYRRSMLNAIGFFDECFGMYLEDLELGWRAQRAGWKAYYVPRALGYPGRGATAKTRRPRWPWLRRYYLPWLSPPLQARCIINRYQLIMQYESLWGLLRDAPWILWYEAALWAYLLCCEWQTARLVGRALLQVCRGGSMAMRPCEITP